MRFILTALLSAVTLAGCATPSQPQGQQDPGARKGVRLCWRLKKGDKFSVEATHREVSSDMRQYGQDLTLQATIGYEVVDVSEDGTAALKGVIRKYSLKGRQPYSHEEVDVRWDATGMSRIEGTFKDPEKAIAWLEAGVEAKIDSRGHLTCGSDQIKSRFLTPSFKRAFVGLLATFPENEVGVGDKWQEELREDDFKSTLDYRVEMHEEDGLTVTTKYRSSPDADSSAIRTGGATTRFDLKRGIPTRTKGWYMIPFFKTAGTFHMRGEIESVVTKE